MKFWPPFFLAVFTSLSASAAGLGFNPFEKGSPTSVVPQKPSPSANPVAQPPVQPQGIRPTQAQNSQIHQAGSGAQSNTSQTKK